jgi:hypothetical protein
MKLQLFLIDCIYYTLSIQFNRMSHKTQSNETVSFAQVRKLK